MIFTRIYINMKQKNVLRQTAYQNSTKFSKYKKYSWVIEMKKQKLNEVEKSKDILNYCKKAWYERSCVFLYITWSQIPW